MIFTKIIIFSSCLLLLLPLSLGFAHNFWGKQLLPFFFFLLQFTYSLSEFIAVHFFGKIFENLQFIEIKLHNYTFGLQHRIHWVVQKAHPSSHEIIIGVVHLNHPLIYRPEIEIFRMPLAVCPISKEIHHYCTHLWWLHFD